MTAEVMMMLGEYKFALPTAAYQQLERSTEYRWATQNRLGRAPARQYVGQGQDTVNLDGIIYPELFKGGIDQVDKMRAVAGSGNPQRLVDGRGRNWGRWCIEQIAETQKVFFADGVPRRIDFRMSLGNYGDDNAGI